MLRESISAVVARNEVWRGSAATEPYEAGWASEAVIFVRALKAPKGPMPEARVEISADGMRWVAEGTVLSMPPTQDAVSVARVKNFGTWLRVATTLPEGAEATVLVTLHLKA